MENHRVNDLDIHFATHDQTEELGRKHRKARSSSNVGLE